MKASLPMDDAQLLQEYASNGSEAAFRTLVQRHLPLVHAAALRQVQDPALAQDVAQAVFLLLGRKASALGSQVLVAGWLFRTTRFVASRARRSEQRRQQREQEAFAMSQLQSPDDTWKRLAPDLDEALSRLAETDRNVLLLRFGTGQSHREVGDTLGMSEEAARKRGQRALEALREFFVRSGVTVSVAALGGIIGERLVAAPPPGLEAGIVARVGSAAPATSVVAGLVRDSVAAWRMIRLRIMAMFVAGAIGILGLAGLGSLMTRGEDRNDGGANPVAVLSEVNGVARTMALPIPAGTFRLTVVSAVDGTPLPHVPVVARWVVGREASARGDLVTGDDGVCVIPLPSGPLGRLDAGANAPGWESRFFTWMSRWQDPLPLGYTLSLHPAERMGGEVRNSRQEPVAGVAVWLDYAISDTSWREPREDRERAGLPLRARVVTIDWGGRWSCSVIPDDCGHFRFEFEHPDFAPVALGWQRDGPESDEERLGRLRAQAEITVLKPGSIVFGSVVDSAGNPVAGARIAPFWSEPGVLSAADGTFSMSRLPRGPLALIATADGFAPSTGKETIEFRSDGTICGKDKYDRPVTGTYKILYNGRMHLDMTSTWKDSKTGKSGTERSSGICTVVVQNGSLFLTEPDGSSSTFTKVN